MRDRVPNDPLRALRLRSLRALRSAQTTQAPPCARTQLIALRARGCEMRAQARLRLASGLQRIGPSIVGPLPPLYCFDLNQFKL